MKLKDLTEISADTRARVYERDSYDSRACCVMCGNPYGVEVHHYIERSRGGLGVEENLICLCNKCHTKYHNTHDEEMLRFIRSYLDNQYEGWEESKLVAKKGQDNG